jgi:ankyrin repeat protein
MSLQQQLDFCSTQNMTPLLLATKNNNIFVALKLIEEGSNIYVQDNKLQNLLHYSIENESEELI